jgi:hypoxanthine phosphoribosyltransferase
MRAIDLPCEVDFMAVASYGSATDSQRRRADPQGLDISIQDRDVLIVEDIVDSGLTLQYLMRNLGARGPPRSRSARCSRSPTGARSTCRSATSASRSRLLRDRYGLDHAERYRNLPYVASLAE